MKRKFKLLCFVALSVVVLSFLCMTVSAAENGIVLGDINGDSVVNIDDAIYLLKHTMLPSRYPVSQPADVNGTGDVNIDDAIYLLKHTMLPSRYPIIIPGTYYTITWKNNDGTLLKTTLCEEDKIPSFGDETPIKESDSQYSYTFSGWANEIVPAKGNTTYIANYTKSNRTSYTISYDANGGTNAPSPQNKSKGYSIKLTSSIPTCEDKTFIGWSCANDGNLYKEGASFSIDADTTLYALWGHDCSTCSASGTVPSTDTCLTCSGSGKDFKSIDKKYPCTTCNGASTESKTCTSCDVSGSGFYFRLYLCSSGHSWYYGDVKKTSCPSCGRSGSRIDYQYCGTCGGDGKITWTCSGCSGLGYFWGTDEIEVTCGSCSGSGEVHSTTTCITCTGEKAIAETYNSYTVMLNDRNSTIETSSVTLNSPYRLTVPTRKGYTFLGWFDAEVNGTQYTDGEGVCLSVWSEEDNKTLYARWSLNYYTITYDCDEDVDISSMPTVYTVEDEDFTLNEQYQNHQTVSWKLGNSIVAIVDTSIAKDITIKGIWTSTLNAPIEENRVEATTCVDGHYDSVVYCSVCHKEVSRETIILYAAHNVENGICTLCGKDLLSYELEFTSNGDDTCCVSGIGDCVSTYVYIPEVSPDGDLVTSIGSYAFDECTHLNIITIPDTVTKIGEYAFRACNSLTSITVPDSVTRIGLGAFSGCNSLEEITVSLNTNYYYQYVDGITFGSPYCHFGYIFGTLPYSGSIATNQSLYDYRDRLITKTYYIPASLKSVKINGSSAEGFENCSNLTSVSILDGVTCIGPNAFKDCTGLTSIAIPDSVETIYGHPFSGCTNLDEIHITDIASWCNIDFSYTLPFYKLYLNGELVTNLVIPDGITTIESYAFGNCTSITSITIPDSVTSIERYAFTGTGYYNDSKNWENDVLYIGDYLITAKTTLRGEYKIKDGTKMLCSEAFSGCSYLFSIIIPDSLTIIDSNCFLGCGRLEYVHISDMRAWCHMNIMTGGFDRAYYLYLNGKLVTNLVIPEDVTSIGDHTFEGCNYLVSITIPEGVTSIGSCAFSGCTGLTSITIPEGVTTIESYAFRRCTGLTRITLPDSVTRIGYCAFEDCSSLTSITIPEGVTSIGSYAFEDCSSLTSIAIPDSVIEIDSNAFYNCLDLSQVYISDIAAWCKIYFSTEYSNPLSIAGNLYLNGKLLTNFIIPDDVTIVNRYAFNRCKSIESITIPDSVTSIGYSAFYNCTNLTSITISDNLTSIERYAFTGTGYYKDSKNWENNALYIGNNLIAAKGSLSGEYKIKEGTKTIAKYAFYNCKSLTSITIPDSVKSIGDYAFDECTGLTKVEITDIVSWCNIDFGCLSNPLRDAENLYLNGKLVTNLVIPEGVTSIGDYTFTGCKSLVSIIIPEGVTSIGEDAFSFCESLENITIPDGVTNIVSRAFYNCKSLVSIIIPEGVKSIGDYAFYNCNSLVSIIIHDGVKSIGDYAFYNCSQLKSIKYGGSVTDWNAITKGNNWNYSIGNYTITYNYKDE